MESEKGNFIKINRSILEWEWYQDTTTKSLFFHLLLKANWKDARWKGYDVKRGSFITSIASLANETGLTVNQVRTALEHLKKTGEITSKTTNRFTIITIVKYDTFQSVQDSESQARPQTDHRQTTDETQTDHRQTTDETQTDHRQTTTIEEYKEEKEDKNYKEEKEDASNAFIWEKIITLYPRCKGQEQESMEKYFNLLAKQEDREEFIKDTERAIINYIEKYDEKNQDDSKEHKFLKGFKRFFDEDFAKELEELRIEKTIFKGWTENGDMLSISQLKENIAKSDFEHRGKAEYMEVLKEIYRAYPVHHFLVDAYENVFFEIVNRYRDGTGADLLYAAVGRYLDEKKDKKQYCIPDLGYWLKCEAEKVMEKIDVYKKMIPEERGENNEL